MSTTAILDTNVLLQAILSAGRSASGRVLDAYFDSRYRLHFSDETLDEILAVLTVPTIQSRHGLSDDELLDFVVRLLVNAELHTVDVALPASLTRDLTDTKFLALAQHANARYLVTNDRRHLLRL